MDAKISHRPRPGRGLPPAGDRETRIELQSAVMLFDFYEVCRAAQSREAALLYFVACLSVMMLAGGPWRGEQDGETDGFAYPKVVDARQGFLAPEPTGLGWPIAITLLTLPLLFCFNMATTLSSTSLLLEWHWYHLSRGRSWRNESVALCSSTLPLPGTRSIWDVPQWNNVNNDFLFSNVNFLMSRPRLHRAMEADTDEQQR